MTELVWDSGFTNAYRNRISKNNILKEEFWDMVELFVQNPFEKELKTHKLTGKLTGLWAFSVNDDCRIVFRFIDKKKVLLIDVGSHDEVY